MASELVELAAHSLNSINPAPRDLPDLLDTLLISQTRVNDKIALCERLASNFTKQVSLVRSRLAALTDANPQLSRRSVPISDLAHQDDRYRVYRSKALLLQHIINQLAFLSWKFGEDFIGQLNHLANPHSVIFLDFLGHRHDHAEDEKSKPGDMQCVEGCDWFSRFGPFEWSKQPYSSAWWKEMNGSNWDWIRVREQIKNVEVETWKIVQSVDICHNNVKRFVPAWMWYESPKMWTLGAGIVLPKETSSESGKSEVMLQVRFVKSEQMKQYERAMLEQQQRQKWVLGGMSHDEAAAKPVTVEVNVFGFQHLHWATAFDGPAIAQDWRCGGQYVGVGSWLNGWGFRKWLEEQAKGKEVVPMANPTIKTE